MAIDVEQYYRQYGPLVLRRCRYLLKNEEEALDIMQEVFIKLLRNEDKLEGEHPSSLLVRIATNECLNHIRSRRRHPEDCDEELLLRIADATDEESRSSARNMLDRIFGRELESTRTIAVLHLLDGLTLEETAEQVGLSVSGVRKRLRSLARHVKELEDMQA